jgi:hypothetical protein
LSNCSDRALHELTSDPTRSSRTAERDLPSYQQFDAQPVDWCLLQDLTSRGSSPAFSGTGFLTAFFGASARMHCRICRSACLSMALAARSIIKDSAPTLTLTTSALLPIVQQELVHALRQQELRCVASDAVSIDLAERWREPAMSSATTAYLQYTSGSTALPKGVVLSHGNILAEAGYMDYGAELCSTSVMVSWLPHFHDMGLVFSLIQPLYNGFPCFFMSPYSFLKEPVRWLKAISRFRGTHSGGPDTGYALCVRKFTPQDRTDLDLSSWTRQWPGAGSGEDGGLCRLFGPWIRSRCFLPGWTRRGNARGVGEPPSENGIRTVVTPQAWAGRRPSRGNRGGPTRQRDDGELRAHKARHRSRHRRPRLAADLSAGPARRDMGVRSLRRPGLLESA